jgi:hypothetical protein
MTIDNELVTEFKQLLELENISFDDYSDEDLQLLLDNKLSELTNYTGINILPTSHKEIKRDWTGDTYEVDYYPISEITSLKVGSKNLTSDDYVLDEEKGILYFHYVLGGMLVLEYSSGFTSEVFASKVKPLLFDMGKYMLTNGSSGLGAMSSVKEGDVQVNYDTSSSLGGLIIARMNNLRASYQCRIRMV